MAKTKGKVQKFFLEAGFYTTALTCFFIPLSTSLLGIFSALTVLCWVLSGNFISTPKAILRHPHALITSVLALLFISGLFYSPVPLEEAVDVLKKYRELFFIPILLSLFYNRPKEAMFAVNSFAGGAIILLFISYGMYFNLLPIEHNGNSHIHHITHSFFMACLAFIALHRFIASWQYKFYWLAVFFMASIDLFLITPGRTGMLVYLVLAVLFVMQRFSFFKFIIAAMCIGAIFAGTYYSSPNVSQRVNDAIKEVKQYKAGSSRTSIGMRFDWYHNSIDLIKQKPLFGHGTGSFAHVQGELIEGTKTKPSDNPHNEYLFVGVQLGLLGLATFFSMFFMQLLCSLNLDKCNRNLVQGVVLSMMTGCLMNSFLFDSQQGHFYAFLIALLFSAAQQQQSSLIINRK